MKAVVSTQNCQPQGAYCLWWGRVGGPDRFRHWVLAASLEDAICRSRLQIAKALGPNANLWMIEESGDKVTRAIQAEGVREFERARRSSQRAGIIAFVFLFLGLLILFEWKSTARGSAGPAENEAVLESSSEDAGACKQAQSACKER